MKMQLPFK